MRRIASVTAISGNVDTGEWAAEFAETEFARLAGRLFYVLHDLNTLQIDPVAEGIDVIVSGPSHVPKIKTVDGLLYVNRGSAGYRRFKLPTALARLALHPISGCIDGKLTRLSFSLSHAMLRLTCAARTGDAVTRALSSVNAHVTSPEM
ncbi:metallophosphoesterase family protein [Bradyrhizobium oropedii]|uniref:metallophosphoesterase family protein n=1 Tax=Bradyrhizobium oropedii TaxID=1571201 RepID=UPI001E318347|nr:metallophosphoesterase family protein [Bradyrhizobium oropedii]